MNCLINTISNLQINLVTKQNTKLIIKLSSDKII